jgi:hypothetical protein
MKKAIIPAFLLVLGSTVLGATVLQEQLAWAAPPLPSVFVANDAANPVPTRELNVDADRNIKVHEQGTADVNVTNTSLPVALEPVTGGGGSVAVFSCPGGKSLPRPVTATALDIGWTSDIGGVILRLGQSTVASFHGPSGGGGTRPLVLALTRPVAFDNVECFGSGGGIDIAWIGNNP